SAAEAALAQAQTEAAAARAALDEALRLAGVAGDEEARAAIRPPARQHELDEQIREYEQARAGVMRRLLEIEPAIAGREVDAGVLASADARCAQAADARRAAE